MNHYLFDNKTYLQNFLEILKHPLQNFWKCFRCTSVKSRAEPPPSNRCVIHRKKVNMQNDACFSIQNCSFLPSFFFPSFFLCFHVIIFSVSKWNTIYYHILPYITIYYHWLFLIRFTHLDVYLSKIVWSFAVSHHYVVEDWLHVVLRKHLRFCSIHFKGTCKSCMYEQQQLPVFKGSNLTLTQMLNMNKNNPLYI